MDLDRAITVLNTTLRRKRPPHFNSSWIARQNPTVYCRLVRSVRTPLGGIDWDTITRRLERSFQKRWCPRHRIAAPYSDKGEVQRALGVHAEKRYLFLTALEKEEKEMRDVMSIALVRLAQRGNLAAHEELLELLPFTIQSWIDSCPSLRKWTCYREELEREMRGCILRFRYSGSFMGYLFKTLLYAGRGLRPLNDPSLDDTFSDAEKRRIENVVQDPETGEIALY